MKTKKLQIEHLDKRIKVFPSIPDSTIPPHGWVKALRSALGITLQQIANKLSITKQSVKEIELREERGTITLNSLREVARSMDMDLVYALVPQDSTLSGLIERKAREKAISIVQRASNTMKLEDQENTKERIQQAIDERTIEIINEIPKSLWD